MPRYKAIIEYDGAAFNGWQKQDDVPSVQTALEEALYKFSGEKVETVAAGRTDAGVHATGQVVHFDIAHDFAPYNVMQGVNFHMNAAAHPHPVAITGCEVVPEAFHARFSALQRHYRYVIINRPGPIVLERGRAWYIRQPLNITAMQEAAAYLEGHHDFTSFRHVGCQAKSPQKTIDSIRILQKGEVIEIYVSAKSFLHHMVRNIAGTLVLVGQGKLEAAQMKKILAAKDRAKAGPTAPAGGLYFIRVDYPKNEALTAQHEEGE